MSLSPMTGTRSRAADLSPLLAAVRNGIYLWPGIPLTHLVGGTIQPLAKHLVSAHLARFCGHAAHHSRLHRALELAAEALSKADLPAARTALAKAELPSVSPDGMRLIRAVAARLGIGVPRLSKAEGVRLWADADLATFAKLYDKYGASALEFEDLFGSTVSPRRFNKSNPNHDDLGRFSSSDNRASGGSEYRSRPGYGVKYSGPDQSGMHTLSDLDGQRLDGAKPFQNGAGIQCVTLVQGVVGAPRTTEWRPGTAVSSETADAIPIGTPLATFDNGAYSQHGRDMHAGLYAGHDATGIFLTEEYADVRRDPNLIITTHYPWTASSRANDANSRIRSANNYSVVTWDADAPPAKVSR